MAIKVPRSLVEFILLGPQDDRRQLQDSPILGDVWVDFATHPGEARELLITPYREQAASRVAAALTECEGIEDSDLAHLQGIIAVRLGFEFVLRHLVPLTSWWNDRRIAAVIADYLKDGALLEEHIASVLAAARTWRQEGNETAIQDLETRRRFVTLAGLLLWAAKKKPPPAWAKKSTEEQAAWILSEKFVPEIAASLGGALRGTAQPEEECGLIWTISLNRKATPAVARSVPAVKADAARTLFTVNCKDIVWAVLDSGIDASHPAFAEGGAEGSRVRKSFDFTAIRKIISYDNALDDDKRRETAARLIKRGLQSRFRQAEVEELLAQLAEATRQRRPTDWEIVGRLVELDAEPAKRPKPPTQHGTHVAGILGARKQGGNDAPVGSAVNADSADGMCPDIGIYDFRVLAPTLQETEFAIIAAMQYIRYLNDRNSYMTVHGANLSLSIPHDVRNYACGRTPVCNECERLVNSGVVVVAAAGNRGYQNFETKDGLYEGYAAFSVTDPGNADGVITVGATHRFWPHTYGVSFFSSRGPTGDGRMKPDLVAPGERIRAPVLEQAWGDLDGTSMAAPHVSGAAAMLMARYSELIGQPRRIKKILCDSATDLGRERSFQGNGMLDVLRAFQSI